MKAFKIMYYYIVSKTCFILNKYKRTLFWKNIFVVRYEKKYLNSDGQRFHQYQQNNNYLSPKITRQNVYGIPGHVLEHA